MKYLITNADDYGYRPDISQAIIDAHVNGILTSTTVLINFVTVDEVALAKTAPNLGFGLHLNLTSGEPLTEMWKTKYGDFSRPFRNEPQQFDREVWLPFFAKYNTDDVYTEYKAQLERFQELFGKMPTHLDSHHYSSSYDTVWPAFKKVAEEHHLPIRRPAIWAVADQQHPMGNIVSTPELDARMGDLKTTTYFSLKYLNRYDDYLYVLGQELTPIKDSESIEVSFHPGYEEAWRVKDLEILKDERVKAAVQKMGFELTTYDQL